MNFPAIAKQTYDLLKGQQAFSNISAFIILHLKKISSPTERAKFVHNVVDEFNREVFAHPLVKELSGCKAGCTGCCHTQVSITEDEAELLARIVNDGLKIDRAQLQKQMNAGNKSEDFYKLSYESRKCVFLGSNNLCLVYEDRPSVCRTNAVLGDSSQCSTENGYDEKKTLRLVKTSQSDMAIIGSFQVSNNSGTLALMLGKILLKSSVKKEIFQKKKSISNDFEL